MTKFLMPGRYSRFQDLAHDTLIADRALRLHDYFIEYGNLLRVLTERRSRSLLDVGCGGGQALIRMKEQYPHLRLTGIDTSRGMITRACNRAHIKDCEINFLVADAEAIPFQDSSFEVVYSFGSAKHWSNPLKGIGECWRVLKPGGELLIADATSDATREQVENFFEIMGFPSLIKKPVVAILLRGMFRPARPVEEYQQIAAELEMPEGTVSHLPSMPTFLFRTRKPAI